MPGRMARRSNSGPAARKQSLQDHASLKNGLVPEIRIQVHVKGSAVKNPPKRFQFEDCPYLALIEDALSNPATIIAFPSRRSGKTEFMQSMAERTGLPVIKISPHPGSETMIKQEFVSKNDPLTIRDLDVHWTFDAWVGSRDETLGIVSSRSRKVSPDGNESD